MIGDYLTGIQKIFVISCFIGSSREKNTAIIKYGYLNERTLKAGELDFLLSVPCN